MTKENPTKAPVTDRVSGGQGSVEKKPKKTKTKALVALGVVIAILLVIAL